jgi:hypothetical protein
MKKMICGQHTAASNSHCFSIKAWFLFVCLLVAGVSGCQEKECVKPGNGGFCGTGSGAASCDTYVTVKSSGCGVGIWGNKWLQLDNGEFLQPWDGPQGLPAVTEGQRLMISYKVIARDHRYDNEITCMALTPPANAIRITCIDTLPPICGTVACGTSATVILDPCFPAYWGEVMLQLDNGDYLRPWEGLPLNQPLQNGQKVKIGYDVSSAAKSYQLICNTLQIIPPFTPVKITCIEPGEVPASDN